MKLIIIDLQNTNSNFQINFKSQKFWKLWRLCQHPAILRDESEAFIGN